MKTDSKNGIRLTTENINQWPKFERLLNDKKIKWDDLGRLRYLHGAPVGDLILVGIDKDCKPIYRESTEEWFDPESQKAKEFRW